MLGTQTSNNCQNYLTQQQTILTASAAECSLVRQTKKTQQKELPEMLKTLNFKKKIDSTLLDISCRF